MPERKGLMKLTDFQNLSRKEAFELIESKIKLSDKITPLDRLSRIVYNKMVTESQSLKKG